jgi:phenylalanyl-tRNA synthetase alpha chain
MLDEIRSIRTEVVQEIPTITSLETLELFRLQYLVKKGKITLLTERLRDVSKEDKPIVGKELNELKVFAHNEYQRLKEEFEAHAVITSRIDVTLPGRFPARLIMPGAAHPINHALDEISSIFSAMGFEISSGPHIEDDHHNFGALNFADDHPARDMQDTFFLQGASIGAPERTDVLLRTHTSSVQIRLMETSKPPIRAIMPGRVYRNEAVSARALAEFHQVEGLYVDKNVSLADLKGTLVAFAKKFYGSSVKYRFRPSFFPFTEPSAEMDITCFLCNGKGCRICKNSGWLEILGAGIVHPNVLRACNIDPDEYSGFAFGMGIERTLLLKLGLDDIRVLYDNDIRFLKQLV